MAASTNIRAGEAAAPDEPLRRGRPARLSREAVLAAARELLDGEPASDLTMTRVAQALRTTTMALYRYFPSREALLTALAESVFAEFDPEPLQPGTKWQDALFHWQCALRAHFEKHRGLTRLMGWGGSLSGPWFRAQMPVIEILRENGFAGRRLAEASTWFLGSTVGMLVVDYASGLLAFHGAQAEPLTLDFVSGLPYLTPRQRVIAEETLPHLPEVDKAALTEFGFRQLIRGLEVMRDTTAATPGAS
jgi:TetR/AcrR family tetracycline transcriptional repressor